MDTYYNNNENIDNDEGPEVVVRYTPKRQSSLKDGAEFECIIGVTYSRWAVMLSAPQYVTSELYGADLMDSDFNGEPTEPGIYKCNCRAYQYEVGSGGGFRFVVRSFVKMNLVEDEQDDLTSLEDMLT